MTSKLPTFEMMLFNFEELVAKFALAGDGKEGSAITVSRDNGVSPNIVIGVVGLALHALMTDFKVRAELPNHWDDFMPMLYDVIEENEQFVFEELVKSGKIKTRKDEK